MREIYMKSVKTIMEFKKSSRGLKTRYKKIFVWVMIIMLLKYLLCSVNGMEISASNTDELLPQNQQQGRGYRLLEMAKKAIQNLEDDYWKIIAPLLFRGVVSFRTIQYYLCLTNENYGEALECYKEFNSGFTSTVSFAYAAIWSNIFVKLWNEGSRARNNSDESDKSLYKNEIESKYIYIYFADLICVFYVSFPMYMNPEALTSLGIMGIIFFLGGVLINYIGIVQKMISYATQRLKSNQYEDAAKTYIWIFVTILYFVILILANEDLAENIDPTEGEYNYKSIYTKIGTVLNIVLTFMIYAFDFIFIFYPLPLELPIETQKSMRVLRQVSMKMTNYEFNPNDLRSKTLPDRIQRGGNN